MYEAVNNNEHKVVELRFFFFLISPTLSNANARRVLSLCFLNKTDLMSVYREMNYQVLNRSR